MQQNVDKDQLRKSVMEVLKKADVQSIETHTDVLMSLFTGFYEHGVTEPSQVDGLPSDAEIDLQAEKIHPFFKTNQYDRGRMDGWQKGAKFFRSIASAIIDKERAEKEELMKRLQKSTELIAQTLSVVPNDWKKELRDMRDESRLFISTLRKENEQLKNPFKDIKNFGKPL